MNNRSISAIACSGPACTASKTADVTERTPAAFRRRLQAWAEVLESSLVKDHWDYGTFGNGMCRADGAIGPNTHIESVSCGTTACAAGWMFLVPEADRIGIGASFRTGDVFKTLGIQTPDHECGDEAVAEWLGLTLGELNDIMFAGYMNLRKLGTVPHTLSMDSNSSSPADVARVIRWIADVKYPSKTIADVMAEETNGFFTQCVTGDETERTPEAFRRRCLAWAELLESTWVENHWSYEQWAARGGNDIGPSRLLTLMPESCDSADSACGTTACAGGWLYLVPEAWRAGSRPGFGWQNDPYGGCSDSSYAEFLGIDADAVYALTRASNGTLRATYPESIFDGLKPLDLKESSPKDVAAYIRRIADHCFPVEVPKKPRTDKPGSKRFLAKLFKDGANFLETHNHTVRSLFEPDTGCYCAMGAVAACQIGEGKQPEDYTAELSRLFPGGSWFDTHWRAIGAENIRKACNDTFGHTRNSTVWGTNDDNVRCVAGRPSKPEDRAKVIRFMRTLAYILEHGGKTRAEYKAARAAEAG